ncbi:MAG: hypothetical protein NVSMB32_18870 [Actinomycetota bacterium]
MISIPESVKRRWFGSFPLVGLTAASYRPPPSFSAHPLQPMERGTSVMSAPDMLSCVDMKFWPILGDLMAIRPVPHLFTVEEFLKMAEVGILGEDDRVELIEGEIIEMTPIGSRHRACVDRLTALLVREVGGGGPIVRIQGAVDLSTVTQVYPDVALLRGRDDFYESRHPGPEDVLLIVEVADSTLDFDLGTKALTYSQAGIRELWVVDLAGRQLRTHRTPTVRGYQDVGNLGPGDPLSPETLAQLSTNVGTILGR